MWLLGLACVLVLGGRFLIIDNDATGTVVEACVPDTCCHASECVWESEVVDCGMSLCSMECRGETMDCGAGHCEVVDGECGVAWDE